MCEVPTGVPQNCIDMQYHDYWCTYGADKIRVAEVVAQRAFAEMFGLGRKF